MSEIGSYEVVAERDLTVAMRDGVRLCTDVYCPAEEGLPLPGPWPAVMTRTAYNKDGYEGPRILLRVARLSVGHAYRRLTGRR